MSALTGVVLGFVPGQLDGESLKRRRGARMPERFPEVEFARAADHAGRLQRNASYFVGRTSRRLMKGTNWLQYAGCTTSDWR